MSKNLDFTKVNEWELSIKQEMALKQEDFKTCSLIHKEIENRIKNKTINKALMSGFRYWNPKTKVFEGEPNYNKVNKLFDKYESNQIE
tara:strand:+ start:327 stop:590 length:264 start_codon:yes stop_codon:yes gene_type:complete